MPAALVIVLLLGIPFSAYAGDWEVAGKVHKISWGTGFAEAFSDPGILGSFGFSPNDNLLLEVEAGEVNSSFRGFRPPTGNMKSMLWGIGAKGRREIARSTVGFLSGGLSKISHDRVVPGADGFYVGGGLDYKFRSNYFARLEGRYFTWSDDGDGGEPENPQVLLALGVGVEF